MDENIKEVCDKELIELMEVCNICRNHEVSSDSYTAPAFMDFTDKPITTEDIPMEHTNILKAADTSMNPKDNAWENRLKNFILDLTSVDTESKFFSCIVLADFEPHYELSTTYLLSKKYGTENSATIYVYPISEDCTTFNMTIRRYEKKECQFEVESKDLINELSIWYVEKKTLTFCHNTDIPHYRDIISMMPDSVWSVFCSPYNFVEVKQSLAIRQAIKGSGKCSYICPVYSYRASKETRAVGTGPIRFVGHKNDPSYIGSMNYYSKYIRSSRHSSGRCYDCETLYKLLIRLDIFRDKRESTPIISFIPNFLESAKQKQVAEVE